MKKVSNSLLLILGLFMLSSVQSFGLGKDTITTLCAKHLEDKFISDGQQYQALLFNSSETA